ncbi:DNA starvation/stationary phase protection protein Dps [Haloferax namakaokahaiae]|uniref:DNA starvation/stationary phase protection protein Dps n=1 Tax=Haloferax namakaokahaiae TaxID=1748331 RepID=A0ABD5ZDZ4_9EURY
MSEQPVGQFYPTQNYLPEEIRQSSAQMLGQVLADATDILSQLRTAHWNVKGPEFYQLHELFEEIAESVEEDIDKIAERAAALGATVSGTVRTSASASQIPELPSSAVEGVELVSILADRLAVFDAILGETIRAAQANGDIDTVDLLNDISRRVSKDLWFLEAHLQTSGRSSQSGSIQQR